MQVSWFSSLKCTYDWHFYLQRGCIDGRAVSGILDFNEMSMYKLV